MVRLRTSPCSVTPTPQRPDSDKDQQQVPDLPPRGANTSTRWRPATRCGHMVDMHDQPPVLGRTRSQQAADGTPPLWCQDCVTTILAVSDLCRSSRNLQRFGVGPIGHLAWWNERDNDASSTSSVVASSQLSSDPDADDAPDIPARSPTPAALTSTSLHPRAPTPAIPSTPASPTPAALPATPSPSSVASPPSSSSSDSEDYARMPKSWTRRAHRARHAFDKARRTVANLRISAATNSTLFDPVDATMSRFLGGIDFANAAGGPTGVMPEQFASVASAADSSRTPAVGGGAPAKKTVSFDPTQRHRSTYREDTFYHRHEDNKAYVPGTWAGDWVNTSWYCVAGPGEKDFIEEEGEDDSVEEGGIVEMGVGGGGGALGKRKRVDGDDEDGWVDEKDGV